MDKKKLLVTQGELREERTATITIRIENELLAKYSEFAQRSRRSRNELINMALKFAYEHMELVENEREKE